MKTRKPLFPLLSVTAGLSVIAGISSGPAYAASPPPVLSQVVTPLGIKDGQPSVLPSQTFSLDGLNFHADSEVRQVTPINRIHIEKTAVVAGKLVFQDVAVVPSKSATAFHMTAVMPSVNPGSYFVQVEVVGGGYSNRIAIKVPQVVLNSSSHISSTSSNTPKVGTTFYLNGRFFPSNPKIWLEPMDNPYMVDVNPSVSYASFSQIAFTIPTMCEGQYRLTVSSQDKSVKTNSILLTIQPKAAPRYQITFSGFKCLTESGDWSDSDETYFIGTSYNLNTGAYDGRYTWVYEDVDAGDEEKETLLLSSYNPDYGDYSGWNEYSSVTNPADLILTVGMAECDNYGLSDDIISGTHWDWHFGYLIDYGKNALTGFTSRIWGDTLAKKVDLKSSQMTRSQKVSYLKDQLFQSLDGAGTGGDDVLGVSELSFTPAEVETARKYFGEHSVTKTLDFTGDGSHYQATFNLYRVFPSN